ncbi:transcription regulator, ArsR family 5 [Thermococcus cleftensis]|uniref:Transcription regulator, ArsR family 5 n=1 Tax=Thermococcus cleftensis (strain DSM 27260 / KACC 17922 / CL1) TaxID=163003 RepID=I3ZSB3_THECF|nr:MULTISPECIES: helix-turn-helix domain-containing protein [Thermococcus]AFL94597.1 transcription regulator, ArsR family 5 [Thermococcus cleftensis]NJE03419.1 transcriptional regulator [Thermococcus sp. MV11]
MAEPDIFYILGNRVRRDLLSHLTCTECYFSFLSSKVSVSSTAVAKHLKIMEREGILRSYEREGPFIGPARKYYDIAIAKTYVATVTPNLFWYRGLDLGGEVIKRTEIDISRIPDEHSSLLEMIHSFHELSVELEKVLQALKAVETRRDALMKEIKERYLKEIGDMTQLAILHYILLVGEATVDELSDRLNLKEREVLVKARELDRFVPLIIKDGAIKIDEERLKQKLGGESDAGED